MASCWGSLCGPRLPAWRPHRVFDSNGEPPLNVTSPLPNSSSLMTAALCVRACTLNGYSLSGLSLSSIAAAACSCGESINAQSSPAPASQCLARCPGGGGDCGGLNTTLILNASCSSALPPPPTGTAIANGSACTQPGTAAWLFCNSSAPLAARIADLVDRIALYEAGPLLTGRQGLQSPALRRLGLPAFSWGIDMSHGITSPPLGGTLCLNSTGR